MANNKPFVAFSLPEEDVVKLYFQKSNSDYVPDGNSENYFILHPFYVSETSHVISKADCDMMEEKIVFKAEGFKKFENSKNTSSREQYLSLVAQAVLEIKKKRATKIVVSREQKISLKNLNLSELFNRIFSLSKNTFRYVWYHPETDIWCGATPELLLKTEGECFQTMALAGTRKYNDNHSVIGWSEKEKHEHRLVVDDITNKLQKAVSVLKMTNSHTHRAGPVVHLKTDIQGCFKKGKASISAIAELLHPTPAVCGTPVKTASEFIKEKEQYNREFYTGYLGCINDTSQNSFLFVNLRCMKITKSHAHIFVGGGITQDSHPEDEWKETQNKLQTMLQVLQPML